MFYNQKATVLTKESASDGMGGWIDGVSVELAVLKVRRAPVSAELMLKEYGLVSTTAMKLYTEDKVINGDIFIHFDNEDYRILQKTEYDIETILLVELI